MLQSVTKGYKSFYNAVELLLNPLIHCDKIPFVKMGFIETGNGFLKNFSKISTKEEQV